MTLAGLTLESTYTSPALFGVATATPVMRAVCRAADGLPLGDLAELDAVRAAFGDVSSLPVGRRPRELGVYSGIRTGKSLFAAAAGFRAAMTVDVRHLRVGEVPRVAIVSLTTDLARVTFGHLVGTLQSRPALRGLLLEEPTADAVLVRHPSGRAIEIKITAGARAGSGLVARWLAGVVADESPRMLGEEDAVVNLDDLRAAAEGRLLEGAQLISIGSPWQPYGPVYDQVQSYAGPSADLVIVRAPAYELNPYWWTQERCAELQRKNPRAYRCDVLAEFTAAESGAFDPDAVEGAFRAPPALAASGRAQIILDPSQGKHDSFTIGVCRYVIPDGGSEWTMDDLRDASGDVIARGVVMRRDVDGNPVRSPTYTPFPAPVLVFDHVEGFDGAFARTLTSDDLLARIAYLAKRFDANAVHSDQAEQFTLSGAINALGLRFFPHTITNASKPRGVELVKRWLADRVLVLPPHARLRQELLAYVERATAAGVSYQAGRGAGHGDYASLIVNAALADIAGHLDASPYRRGGGVKSRLDA